MENEKTQKQLDKERLEISNQIEAIPSGGTATFGKITVTHPKDDLFIIEKSSGDSTPTRFSRLIDPKIEDGLRKIANEIAVAIHS